MSTTAQSPPGRTPGRRRRLCASAALGAGAVLLGGGIAGTAHAVPGRAVTCGETIVADTRLVADLSCPSGDALRIGADGVTLDLGGYTISGPGAYADGVGAGVRVAFRRDVTVRNGTLSGFGAGVVLDTTTGVRVRALTLTDNDRGIDLAGARDSRVERNVVLRSGRDAIRLGLSADNAVQHNVLVDNVFGIAVADGSTRNLVDQNDVRTSRAFGIAVFAASTDTTISKNRVTTTADDGIAVEADTQGTVLTSNVVERNGDDGIDVDATSTRLTGNVARGNGDLGIEAVPGVTDGGGNAASGNGSAAQCLGVACRG